MFSVTVHVPADQAAFRMGEMHAWLDRQRCIPEAFAYGETTSHAVARFGFARHRDAEAFSAQFAGRLISPLSL